MSPLQIHLAINHIPILAPFFALPFLLMAVIRGCEGIKPALLILVLGGVFAVPAFLSGGEAEEMVEDKPGISENLIEEHEEAAEQAMILACIVGGLALASKIWMKLKGQQKSRILAIVFLVLSLVSLGMMMRAGHAGGLIGHEELRNGKINPPP